MEHKITGTDPVIPSLTVKCEEFETFGSKRRYVIPYDTEAKIEIDKEKYTKNKLFPDLLDDSKHQSPKCDPFSDFLGVRYSYNQTSFKCKYCKEEYNDQTSIGDKYLVIKPQCLCKKSKQPFKKQRL